MVEILPPWRLSYPDCIVACTPFFFPAQPFQQSLSLRRHRVPSGHDRFLPLLIIGSAC